MFVYFRYPLMYFKILIEVFLDDENLPNSSTFLTDAFGNKDRVGMSQQFYVHHLKQYVFSKFEPLITSWATMAESEGCGFDPSPRSRHVDVSLGKILNPQLLPIMAIVYECVCMKSEWHMYEW